MSAYYKCEIEKDGYKEDVETAEPAKLPYYAYVILVFLLIAFLIILIIFLIKYRNLDILGFVKNPYINERKPSVYFAIFGVSAFALIILSMVKISKNDGNYVSSPVFSVFLMLFIFTLILSIVNMAVLSPTK